MEELQPYYPLIADAAVKAMPFIVGIVWYLVKRSIKRLDMRLDGLEKKVNDTHKEIDEKVRHIDTEYNERLGRMETSINDRLLNIDSCLHEIKLALSKSDRDMAQLFTRVGEMHGFLRGMNILKDEYKGKSA